MSDLPEWPEALPAPLLGRKHHFLPRPVQTLFESGRSRNRRAHTAAIELIEVQWNFTKDEFGEFRTFFETDLVNGSLAFTLITYDPAPDRYYIREVTREVAFHESIYNFTKSDNLFSVSATLEVVDISYFQLENPLDRPPPEPPLGDLAVTYPSICRDEFVCTMNDLVEGYVYALQISTTQDGVYSEHVYFALQSEEEISTGTKILTLNNDYLGDVWFRAAQIRRPGNDTVRALTRGVKPLASVIAPPVISITNLSEVTIDEQLNATPDSAMLKSLEFYKHGIESEETGWVIPYSIIEDPITFNTAAYYRFQKKYAWRQWGLVGAGDFTEMKGNDFIISLSGEAGATHTYTRDKSDPLIVTTHLPMNGFADNAAPGHNDFAGVIKARSFKDGCRSPLSMVAIDKLMYERGNIETQLIGQIITAACDYPKDGLESGQSCELVYGGICNFEAMTYAVARAGTTPVGGEVNEVLGPTVHVSAKTLEDDIDILGYSSHGMYAGYSDLSDTIWSLVANEWATSAPNSHNWAIAAVGASVGLIPTTPGATLAGNPNTYRTVAWKAARHFAIAALLNPLKPEAPQCAEERDVVIRLTRFDVMRSPLPLTELRNYYWDQITPVI